MQHPRLQFVRALVELREATSAPGREMELTPPPVSGIAATSKQAFGFQLLDLACHDGRRDSQGPRQIHHAQGAVFAVLDLS
jgi:hypothetical protein